MIVSFQEGPAFRGTRRSRQRMHLELASLPTEEETVARKEAHFSKLSSQQTGFHFESEAAVDPGILNKAHWL